MSGNIITNNEQWFVDQLLGAGSYENLPAAVEEKIQQLVGTNSATVPTLDAVQATVNADIDNATVALLGRFNFISVFVVEGILKKLADAVVADFYAQAVAAIGQVVASPDNAGQDGSGVPKFEQRFLGA